MNIGDRGRPVHRGQQLLGDEDAARSAATRRVSYFFHVPAGTPAFKVDLSGPSATPGTGQARFLRFHPYGVGDRHRTRAPSCYSPPVAAAARRQPDQPHDHEPAGRASGRSRSRRGARPTSADVPFTLTASILGATVSPNPDTIASATIGVPIARSYTLTNLFGAFTGRAVGTTLGSATASTPTRSRTSRSSSTRSTVTAGSTSLRATIGSPSDPAADLDLFVFNCTTGTCVLAGQSADGDSEESVTIANPAAGTWVVLVDGFAVPAGTTTYNYVDVFANPAFGSVVGDRRQRAAAGRFLVDRAGLASPRTRRRRRGRVLLGNVQVRTDTNVLVGSGDVIVQSVTP